MDSCWLYQFNASFPMQEGIGRSTQYPWNLYVFPNGSSSLAPTCKMEWSVACSILAGPWHPSRPGEVLKEGLLWSKSLRLGVSRPVAFDTPRFEMFTYAVRAPPFLMRRRKLLSEGLLCRTLLLPLLPVGPFGWELPVHSWLTWCVKED